MPPIIEMLVARLMKSTADGYSLQVAFSFLQCVFELDAGTQRSRPASYVICIRSASDQESSSTGLGPHPILQGPYPIPHSMQAKSQTKRISRACQRCRLRKSKCNL